MTATLSVPSSLVLPPRDWWALHLSGDLDLVTGPDLDARLGRAMTLHPGDGFVLDLAAVPFMDCAGLSPVLRARNRLGNRFCLRVVHPRVLRLLDVAGVAASLRILPAAGLWPTEADPLRCHVVLDDPSASPLAASTVDERGFTAATTCSHCGSDATGT